MMARPRGGDWLGDELRWLSADGVNVLLSMLTREEVAELGLNRMKAICGMEGIEFWSFPVADRGVPESSAAFSRLL